MQPQDGGAERGGVRGVFVEVEQERRVRLRRLPDGVGTRREVADDLPLDLVPGGVEDVDVAEAVIEVGYPVEEQESGSRLARPIEDAREELASEPPAAIGWRRDDRRLIEVSMGAKVSVSNPSISFSAPSICRSTTSTRFSIRMPYSPVL